MEGEKGLSVGASGAGSPHIPTWQVRRWLGTWSLPCVDYTAFPAVFCLPYT